MAVWWWLTTEADKIFRTDPYIHLPRWPIDRVEVTKRSLVSRWQVIT